MRKQNLTKKSNIVSIYINFTQKYTKFLLLLIILFFIIYKPNKNQLIMKKLNFKCPNKDRLFSISQDKLKMIEKSKLLDFISKAVSKNITFVKYIYLKIRYHFGNQLLIIYKTIFYCEILGCKKIILDKNKNNWFIKNKIIYKKHKIIVEVNAQKNINNLNIIIDRTTNFFYYKCYIKQEYRVNILKNEILKNLPKVRINNRDLFIYIRSGDIFIKPHKKYVQPPLCFYVKVLNKFVFGNIYIISQNKNNPVIRKLLENYSNIIYLMNSLEFDIAYLVSAYNIVGGAFSTFLFNVILLNNNLRFLWDFEFKKLNNNISNKYKINYFLNSNRMIRFLMFASDKYSYEMRNWKNSQAQLDLMINDKCNNNFFLIIE